MKALYLLILVFSSPGFVTSVPSEREPADEEITDPNSKNRVDLTQVVDETGVVSEETKDKMDEKLERISEKKISETALEAEAKIQNEQNKMGKKNKHHKKPDSEPPEGPHVTKEKDEHVRKRYIYENYRQWKHAIVPWRFNASLETWRRNAVRKAMAVWEYYTCAKFVEWTETTKTDYDLDHNNYLLYLQDPGKCWSYVGNLNKTGQSISCCSVGPCIHEIGHAFGFYHEQGLPWRNDYLRVNYENVKQDYRSQYRKFSSDEGINKMFKYNYNSDMHYGLWYFNNGGGETMTVFDPQMKYLIQTSDRSQFYLYKEFNIVYDCKSKKCPNFALDCKYDGYVAYMDKKCQCRCIEGLDPKTGCSTLLRADKKELALAWPKAKFAFLKPSNAKCPNGSAEGSLTHKSNGGWTSNSYQAMGDHETLHFCSFLNDERTGETANLAAGEYCFTRVGGSCPTGMEEGFIEFVDVSVTTTGSIPDVLKGKNTRLEFCCRRDGDRTKAIVFPTADRFILWQTTKDNCQAVKDTISESHFFAYRMKTGEKASSGGLLPVHYNKDNIAYVYFCVYQPISKECGQIVDLTDAKPSVEVTSPYYPHAYHANMECNWIIKGKPGKRLVLTFETFHIPKIKDSCVDSLEVKYSLPGQLGIKYCGESFKQSIYTFKNYITLKLDSKNFQHGKKFKALIRMIRDEDLCYYGPDNGYTYRGKVAMTRNFKSCKPWSQATKCPHNPTNIANHADGLEDNYCRNPRSGLEPWCYTTVDDCTRDYCDVCGFGTCFDILPNCAELIKADAEYCKSPSKWKDGIVGCAKSCGFCEKQSKHKYNDITCKKPPSIPKGMELLNPEKLTSKIGEKVFYYYPSNKYNMYALNCFSDGSLSRHQVCPDEWVYDESTKKCNRALVTELHDQYYGEQLCAKYGGYLATILTEAENDLITKLVHRSGKSEMLIGLGDRYEEGKYFWSTGQAMIPGKTYSNWHNDSTPNNYRNQDCCTIDSKGFWNDDSCKKNYPGAVCQIETPVSLCKDGSTNCDKLKKTENVAINKISSQSSTYSEKYLAKYGNDGIWTGSNSTSTKKEQDPWWEVNLQGTYLVRSVVLVAAGSEFKNIIVTVGEQTYDMKPCGSYPDSVVDEEAVEIKCKIPMHARYVKVQMKERAYLELNEVAVKAYAETPNIECLAPSVPNTVVKVGTWPVTFKVGTTLQYHYPNHKQYLFTITCLSSKQWTKSECPDGWTYEKTRKLCNVAVVSQIEGRYYGEQLCANYGGYLATILSSAENQLITTLVKTAKQSELLIGLGDIYEEGKYFWPNGEQIIGTSYTNWKADGSPNNYNNQDCSTIDSDGFWNDDACSKTYIGAVCQIATTVTFCEDRTINCHEFKKTKNVAVKKISSQSSTYSDEYLAKYGNDGVWKGGKSTSTNNEENPWWEVYLEGTYYVSSVVLVAAGHYFKNVVVTMGEQKHDMKICGAYPGSAVDDETFEIKCKAPQFARYVKVQLKGKAYLELNEVVVKAYTETPNIECYTPPSVPNKAVKIGTWPNTFKVGTLLQYRIPTNEHYLFSHLCLSTKQWTKSDCPDGSWHLDANTNKCNKVFLQSLNERYAGDQLCREYGAYTGTIQSDAENKFVRSLVLHADQDILIGLDDKAKEGTYIWSTGDKMDFQKFDSAHHNKDSSQDCVVMDTAGYWKDSKCYSDYTGVLCQISRPVGVCSDGSDSCEQFKKVKNVAENKKVTQSSTYSSYWPASFAVDGILRAEKSTCTKWQTDPWLEVDLGAVFSVKRVVLVNANGYRFKNVFVKIGEESDSMADIGSFEGPATSDESIEFTLKSSRKARYVKVQIVGIQSYLQLHEVLVFALV